VTGVTIGLLHPGDMGATVGAAARANGARVLWASSGRGLQTQKRAAAAGLTDAGTVAGLVRSSDLVLSVCPPSAAGEVARSVAASGFAGVYVDANAVSPATAREVGEIVTKAGATFVDGGIIGPPARTRGTTRLYLAGPGAARVAACFAEGPLDAIVLDGAPGAASALKMAYAAYTKGSTALLAAVRALASHEGVGEALLEEWQLSQPEAAARADAGVRASAPKAWRFVGEMEEIAATFASAGLPDGFHRAAAELYRRLAAFKDATPPPTVTDIVATLLHPAPD
jgi:3-hydroxyisobutyrate dehydrogenase-like beta-hydroxyacid dehydrogenase